MPQLKNQPVEGNDVLSRLEGDDCSFCDGTLTRGRYKGNDAVVCSECKTPTAQVW